MAQRLGRLKRECQLLQESPPSGVSCWPEGDKMDVFSAVIVGDEDTVYAGGMFRLELEVPERYPFLPPKVRFLTKIYHPNIDSAGRICLDILKLPPTGSWRPAHNLSSVLTSIRLLMAAPNPNDPLMTEIAEEYQFRKSQYEATAREWTAKFAKNMGAPNSDESENAQSSAEKRAVALDGEGETSGKKMKI
ncbi:ubiquitin-conjugating enzyme E2 T-like [Panulirus ornatus]|uniref:ubiquitin-conjugating enzyme E2 T-like n=1 Tax=Panulirus ornatus TaxID=150431 RepID=UPI003A8B1927